MNTKPIRLLVLLAFVCLGAVKAPSGARQAWFLMQRAAVVQPGLLFTVTPPMAFNLYATTNIITPRAKWTFVGRGTNALTVPMTALASFTNPPVFGNILAWDQSKDPITAGYNIWWGTNSHQYISRQSAGTNTMTTVSGLRQVKYFYAATCYSKSNVQSAFSAEVSAMAVPLPQPRTIFFIATATGSTLLTIKTQ